MKIALIAPNPTFQTDDLESEAKKRGHTLERILLKEIDVSNPKEDKTIKRLFNYDIVYFRNGADRITKKILGETLYAYGRIFINSGYFKNPLLSDKIYQVNTISSKNIRVPKTFTIKSSQLKNSYSALSEHLGDPFIIKPSIGAQGFGVELVKTEKEYLNIIQKGINFKPIFQEYIPNDGDYRILVVNHKAIGTYKRIPPRGDFRANISQGGSGEIVQDTKLKKQLFEISERITPLLNLEIAGIDIIRSLKNNNLYFIESNSIPQWEGFKNTTSINVSKLIINYFESILKE